LKEVIRLNDNVNRAIIRFVEKQMPQVIDLLKGFFEHGEGIETNLDRLVDSLNKFHTPSGKSAGAAYELSENEPTSRIRRRFMLTIDEQELRNIRDFIHQTSDHQVLPDDLAGVIRELFYIDGGRQHGVMDKRMDVGVEEV
jgi:hypothetical protein